MTDCKTVRSLGETIPMMWVGGVGGYKDARTWELMARALQERIYNNKVGHLGRGKNVRDTSSLCFSYVVRVQLGRVDEGKMSEGNADNCKTVLTL